MIISGYRKADYADIDTFITQLGAALAKYSPQVIEYVTAPGTGIQFRSKWPPSLAEIIEACEAEAAFLTKTAQASTIGQSKPLPRPKFSAGQSYEEMFAKHGRPTGVFELNREHPYG